MDFTRGRLCRECKQWKEDEEFTGPRGWVCIVCQKEHNRQKHARYRRENPEYNRKKNAISAAWKKSDKGRKWHAEYQRAYMKTPNGIRCQNAFRENNPYYNRIYYAKRKINNLLGALQALLDDHIQTTKESNNG